MKCLCKLVGVTKSYAIKQKGVFFSEHSIDAYVICCGFHADYVTHADDCHGAANKWWHIV